MRMVTGYSLIDVASGETVETWGGVWGECPGIPNPLILPNGDHVCAAQTDEDYSGFMLKTLETDKPPQTVMDGLSFLSRFSDDEYGEIIKASHANVQVARWFDAVRLSNAVDLSAPPTLAAKANLVALGILVSERAEAAFAIA